VNSTAADCLPFDTPLVHLLLREYACYSVVVVVERERTKSKTSADSLCTTLVLQVLSSWSR
jgi:hypothetical protein